MASMRTWAFTPQDPRTHAGARLMLETWELIKIANRAPGRGAKNSSPGRSNVTPRAATRGARRNLRSAWARAWTRLASNVARDVTLFATRVLTSMPRGSSRDATRLRLSTHDDYVRFGLSVGLDQPSCPFSVTEEVIQNVRPPCSRTSTTWRRFVA